MNILAKNSHDWEKVAFYANYHRLCCNNLGEVKKYWIDENGVFCIQYENGEWFHYQGNVYSVNNGIIDGNIELW